MTSLPQSSGVSPEPTPDQEQVGPKLFDEPESLDAWAQRLATALVTRNRKLVLKNVKAAILKRHEDSAIHGATDAKARNITEQRIREVGIDYFL